MNSKKVKISEVKENPKNPRSIKKDKFEKLVKSIITFPQMMNFRPIVIDENNVSLGGNMRYKGCAEVSRLGKDHAESILKENNLSGEQIQKNISLLSPLFEGCFPEGWVQKEAGLSEDQKDEFIIKDNLGFGEWDWDILANEWDTDLLEDWGLDVKFPKDEDDEVPEEHTYIPVFRFEVTCATEKEKNKLMADLLTKGYSCTEDY